MGPMTERARVLVVDDEPIVGEVVARYLARAGPSLHGFHGRLPDHSL
jgi:CheY-like chemotaxis protein